MNINVFKKIRQATVDGVRYYSLLDVCKVIGHKNNGFGHGFTRKKNVPMPRVKLSATDWIGLMLFLEERLSHKSNELLAVMKFDTEANAPNFRKPRKSKPKPVQSTEMAVRPSQLPVAVSVPVQAEPAPSSEMAELIRNMFEGHEVRTAIKIDGTVWFVLVDVCEAIGIVNHNNVAGRVRDKYRDAIHLPDSIGRLQSTTIVSEPGLLSLVMTSRVEKAEDFQDWVLEVVLPSIRKTGSYVPQKQMTNVELAQMVIAEAAEKEKYAAIARTESTRANIEQGMRQLADEKLVEVKRVVDALQPLAEEGAWKGAFEEASDELITITDAAKLLDCQISRSGLFKYLGQWNWLTKGKSATASAVKKNWMRMEFWESNGMTGYNAKLTRAGFNEVQRRLRFESLELSQKTMFEERIKKGKQ
jgi:prophage antirepressor-like protein